ncbi:MAG: Hsp20/alpha crystallin family protein [Candidatus Lokiarchaeota archaeon]
MPEDDEYIDDDDEDDDEDFEGPFDFFKFFQDPNKFLNSKKFQKAFSEIFEKILENLPPEFKNLSPEDIKREFMKNKSKFGFPGPFMAGFNINFDSDGNPIIDSFGNIKSKTKGKSKVDSVREPLVEVSEEEDKLIVIAEMPGVTKEDIELKATSHSLTISTNPQTESGKKYYKEVILPTSINSEYAKARYKNGILEVKLKKMNDEHKNIKVD